MDIQSYGENPGMTALAQTTEAALWAGREQRNEYSMLGLSSAARDVGSSPTTTLRPGLILGKITSSGLLKEHNPAGTDGSEIAYCVLAVGQTVLDSSGTAANKNCHVLMKGILQSSNLLLLTAQTRSQLFNSGRYRFVDDLWGLYGAGAPMPRYSPQAGPTLTVVAADVGTLFYATGALAVTLPTIAAGLGPFEFFNGADATMSIASAGSNDNIIWDNDAACDSISFQTASHKLGGYVQIRANPAGDKWIVKNFSPATCTVTAA